MIQQRTADPLAPKLRRYRERPEVTAPGERRAGQKQDEARNGGSMKADETPD